MSPVTRLFKKLKPGVPHHPSKAPLHLIEGFGKKKKIKIKRILENVLFITNSVKCQAANPLLSSKPFYERGTTVYFP